MRPRARLPSPKRERAASQGLFQSPVKATADRRGSARTPHAGRRHNERPFNSSCHPVSPFHLQNAPYAFQAHRRFAHKVRAHGVLSAPNSPPRQSQPLATPTAANHTTLTLPIVSGTFSPVSGTFSPISRVFSAFIPPANDAHTNQNIQSHFGSRRNSRRFANCAALKPSER